jgi:hypothetical protein
MVCSGYRSAKRMRCGLRSGDRCEMATMRANLYELLLKQPLLKALKETGASFDLGPPRAAELAEIVRAPKDVQGEDFAKLADEFKETNKSRLIE